MLLIFVFKCIIWKLQLFVPISILTKFMFFCVNSFCTWNHGWVKFFTWFVIEGPSGQIAEMLNSGFDEINLGLWDVVKLEDHDINKLMNPSIVEANLPE